MEIEAQQREQPTASQRALARYFAAAGRERQLPVYPGYGSRTLRASNLQSH